MQDSLTFMDPATAARVIRTLDTHIPTIWEDYLNLSSAFFVVGETDLALLNARLALSMERTPETLLNLAVILESQGKFNQAFSLSLEAASLSDDRLIVCHATDSLLRMGWFEEAWRRGYSHSHADWAQVVTLIPEWDGRSSLVNQRVLVLPGGGYGDEILFLRWMDRLQYLGATVTYACPPTLAPLAREFSSIHDTISGSAFGDPVHIDFSRYDYFIPIRSLAEHFCPNIDTIPTAPYIHSRRPATVPTRVGLCTRAGEESFPRRHRSLTTDQRGRIIAALGEKFVSLNYEDLAPNSDWSHTRDLISTLRLVITVDTGIAHLAGAMGVPCWVILPGISAAYYGTRGDRSWFYPSQRLFRNHAEGNDNSVEAVCNVLRERA